MVKKELSRKAKLSIYQSIYVPVLTYGQTEARLSLRDRVRSSDIREDRDSCRASCFATSIGVSLGQLGHLARMPSGRLPLEVFLPDMSHWRGGLVAGQD
ncbi:hypothetical protein D4764_15G0005680 [Takifugu flavidus]|uniref:Uncharacterized protein n=1 Tax=Takifugu flavidus TaxID=433684 RepID=A0A5C6P090_9TELE|nr:hypothetical protein D4764_15G0005680 [Takifugu flavidus]